MDTITLINALIEWAEWWEDKTGFVSRPYLWEDTVTVTTHDYGAYHCADDSLIADFVSDTHAWFLLLIAADLEYSL